MTTFFIDLGIIGIVAFCAWRGYRNGLIRGVFGIVTLIVSIFLANTIARAYADEFTGVLTPFAGGVVESALFGLSDISERTDLDIDFDTSDLEDIIPDDLDLGSIDISDLIFRDIDLSDLDLDSFEINNINLGSLNTIPDRFIAAYLSLRHLGMSDAASAQIAYASAEDDSGKFFPIVVGENLALSLSYIALFGITFLLLTIVFTVIGNLIGVFLTLPGLRLVDSISGIVFGLVKGIIIVLAIGVIVRYFSFLPIVNDLFTGTTVLSHIANNNIIANILGV